MYCVQKCLYIVLIYIYKKKHLITFVIHFYNYTITKNQIHIITQIKVHRLHFNPPLNLPILPNLSLTLPVCHLNSSKSVLQYNMNTIRTLYLFLFLFFFKVSI